MYGQEDLVSIMEEPPGGENYGQKARILSSGWENDQPASRVVPMGDPVRTDFLHDGGWGVERGTAHRGVLHHDEHVDGEKLQTLVEKALGYSYEQIRSVYRQGPLSPDQRQLRDKIDARLLALSRSGNMTALAKILGWSHNVIENAVARARAAA